MEHGARSSRTSGSDRSGSPLPAPGSELHPPWMTFLLPLEMADPEVRPGLEMAQKGARASGTPFISFFTPQQITTMAREARDLGEGLNWYLNQNLRWMFDFDRTQFQGGASTGNRPEEKALLLQIQLTF